ncbi:MAG: hypothetical protein GY944_08655 [bacterium]|nr:hypothetical protein [bacterium]
MTVQAERLALLSATVNGRMLDRAIRHSIYIRRLGVGNSTRVLTFLNDEVFPELVGTAFTRLERLRGRGLGFDFTQERYSQLIGSLDTIIREGFKTSRQSLQTEMRAFAKTEAEFATGSMRAAAPINLDTFLPGASTLNSIVSSAPIVEGKHIPQVFADLAHTVKLKVEQAIKVGIVAGETTASIVQRLRGKGALLDQSRNGVTALVRTVTNAVSSAARAKTYEENEDLLNGWQFVATLDGRTTMICAQNDGTTHKVGEGPMPPLHTGCRSTSAPVLKSFRDLGIPIDDIPDGGPSMDGKPAGKINYGDWLAQQPPDVQDDFLGVAKGKLYRRGHLTFDKFADNNGRPYSLADLQKKEADVIAKRGLPKPKAKASRAAKAKRAPKKPKVPKQLTGRQVREAIEADPAIVKARKGIAESQATIKRLEEALPWNVRMHGERPGPSGLLLYSDQLAELSRAQNTFVESRVAAARAAHKHMRVAAPAGIEGTLAKAYRTKGFNANASESTRFLSAMTSRPTLREMPVTINKTARKRAYQVDGKGVFLNRDSPTRTFIHEIGHEMEHYDSSLAIRSRDFLAARAAKDPKGLRRLAQIQPGRGFRRSEVAWEDKFIDAYMGKKYTTASEIMSMGLEYIYAEPLTLIDGDPGYFDFVVDSLRGIK